MAWTQFSSLAQDVISDNAEGRMLFLGLFYTYSL